MAKRGRGPIGFEGRDGSLCVFSAHRAPSPLSPSYSLLLDSSSFFVGLSFARAGKARYEPSNVAS